MKHILVFGPIAYVVGLPSVSKFEAKAVEVGYLETTEHGVFKVLVKKYSEFGELHYSIVESGHVTFDVSRFLGAEDLCYRRRKNMHQ